MKSGSILAVCWDFVYMISSPKKGWYCFYPVSETGIPAEFLRFHILQLFCSSYRFPGNFLTDPCFQEARLAPVFIWTGTTFLQFEVRNGTFVSRIIRAFLRFTSIDALDQEMPIFGKFEAGIYFIWFTPGKIRCYQLEVMGCCHPCICFATVCTI